ncbi:MAG: DUF3536 domain-containing protein [Spirochaetales bacterium]|nr:DUF3536 domain-containing protein [Spirochaetales bacterium]MCF7939643.1 DUF3536 domain-containing protein [Spirochaetales bacterium]
MNYLIMHAHFYQPPREDPWTGLIPKQPSASPYHDWNERITRECYGPCAFSRILDESGNIVNIINNYQYLSFNFGPTLLKWLETSAPVVYERILEGDRLSIEANGGHGNAIAQAYNHTILPLASPNDARLQIRWGLEDFRRRFERDPEGMWLPETAVNPVVLDLLIDEGMKFVILSPWQASAVEGSSGMEEIPPDQPVDWRRPYRLDRPGGSIAACFYNPVLAQGISFEHYLRNADMLAEHIRGFADPEDPNRCISVATDGEIYGHHEPFGDMCFSALTGILEEDKEIELTNYGKYLEMNPPKKGVRLKEGEDSHGSSWSCVHGVSRWYRDCGCSTGGRPGWNQKWRTPLREAFDFLKRKIDSAYRKEIKHFTEKSPDRLLREYGSVVTGKESGKKFAERFEGNSSDLLFLLEGMKYAQFMFTSCGWFFAEINSIEPVQNMRYAYKAFLLYRRYLSEEVLHRFLEILDKARSNLKESDSGKKIFKRHVIRKRRGSRYAASLFVLSHHLGLGVKAEGGHYAVLDHREKNSEEGELELEDSSLARNVEYNYHIEREGEAIYLSLRRTTGKSYQRIKLSSLPEEIRDHLITMSGEQIRDRCGKHAEVIFPHLKQLLDLSGAMETQIDPSLNKLMEANLACLFESRLDTAGREFTDKNIAAIEEVLFISDRHNITFEEERIEDALTKILDRHARSVLENRDPEELALLTRLIEACRRYGLGIQLFRIQNEVFHTLQKAASEKTGGKESDPVLLRLGGYLGINTQAVTGVPRTEPSGGHFEK